MSKNQGCREFWGSCFSACPRNTTRATSCFGIAQTVLLTTGHRSKPQNSRYPPKFSEAALNPELPNNQPQRGTER
jgi:hypothetical protein